MRKLKAYRAGQERWSHNQKEYSIVDLCAWPEDTSPPEGPHWDRIMSYYKPHNYELAYTPKQGRIIIIGRYKSFQEARSVIEDKTPTKEEQ